MTNEEAIKILRHWGSSIPAFDRDCAVKMAIEALEKPEPCEDAVSRAEAKKILYDFAGHIVDTPNGIYQQAYKTYMSKMDKLPSVTPKQRTGKWILDRSGAYCCSECMEPCASYVMMKPRDKFCKMCGSRNEATT